MDALRPLSLDQFAAMTAEMEAGFPRDRVLEDASVSAEQWELTQETWLLRMAKQGSQRKLALLDRYNELLAKHRKAAQRKMRAEKRKLKGPMPVAPEAHLSPIARVPNMDGVGATFQQAGFTGAPERPSLERPSFAAAPGPGGAPAWLTQPAAAAGGIAAPPMVAPPPVILGPSLASVSSGHDDTMDGDDDDAEMHTEIVLPGMAAPVAATGPAWLQSKPSAALSTTAKMVDGPAVAGPAWLAGKGPPRAEDAPPAVVAAPAPPPSSPGVAPAGPAWLHGGAAAPGAVAPPAVAAPVAIAAADAQAAASAAARPKPKLGGTRMDMSAADFAAPAAGPAWLASATPQAPREATPARAADALPFQRASAAAAPAPQAAADGLPFQRPSIVMSAQPVAAAAPAPVAPAAVVPAAAAQPAVAAAGAAAANGPRLTIEQLAWLQAQIETSPELGRAAREKLGMSEADYAGERAFWQVRFQQDRATLERYSQLFYHYRGKR